MINVLKTPRFDSTKVDPKTGKITNAGKGPNIGEKSQRKLINR